jgi:hypothetical protein
MFTAAPLTQAVLSYGSRYQWKTTALNIVATLHNQGTALPVIESHIQ